MSNKDIAIWMNDMLIKNRRLDQSHAAHLILKQWGKAYLYQNANGNWAINKPILDAFRKLNPPDVVWSRGSQVWRFRMPYDPPTGRMVS